MDIISKLARTLAAVVLAVGLISNGAYASEQQNVTADGLAINGFDVVSCFDASTPAKGNGGFTYEYRDATWVFKTAENRDLFTADPAKYEPEFDGWCANAVSKGYAADVDFVNGWVVIDGSFHLFWANSTKQNFVSDVTAKRVRAADYWPTVYAGVVDRTVKFPRHAEHFASLGILHPQKLPEG